jgi:hypothetical protein
VPPCCRPPSLDASGVRSTTPLEPPCCRPPSLPGCTPPARCPR